MQKMRYDVLIHADREKVWDAVVGDREFREWTKPFSETSRFEGGWSRGDRIRFLATGQNGETEGMLAEIAESRRPEYLSIRHLGLIQGGVEDTTSEAVKAWAPAYENYTLKEAPGGTRFEVELDVQEEYAAMMSEAWPKALAALKAIAER